MKEILHQYPCIVDELSWDLTIVHGSYPDCKKAKHCKAIWDTGASDTTMSTEAIRLLGLERDESKSPKQVNTANGIVESYAYHACIVLSPDWPPLRTIVWGMPPSGVEVLIGMDIISQGIFQLWPQDGRTMLRFAVSWV